MDGRMKLPSGQGSRSRWVGGLRVVGLMVLGALLAGVVAYVGKARRQPDLRAWHRLEPREELKARELGEGFDLEDYIAREERLFAAVATDLLAVEDEPPRLSRYRPLGPTNPATLPRNWNRTFVIEPAKRRGAAVLLHGLSDSPYSVRSLAETLAAQGLVSIGLRLPGHGTVPGDLRQVSWEDWRAAVRVAVRAADEQRNDGALILAGYSNGAALALDHAVSALSDPSLPRPDGLVFLSPAFAVTRMAALARWQLLFSRLPGMKKLAWSSIESEFDPFKYNSFPMRAAEEIHLLTSELERGLERLEERGGLEELPPALTFASRVDGTVPLDTSLGRLYGRLRVGRIANGSELVVFDVNRLAEIEEFLSPEANWLPAGAESPDPLPFSLTVVTNSATMTSEVEAHLTPAGSTRPHLERLGLEWPQGVYSLSHVAVPFPPDDPVYGTAMELGDPFPFGLLEARGERGALAVPLDLLMRQRYNPFHAYLTRRVAEFVADSAQTAE